MMKIQKLTFLLLLILLVSCNTSKKVLYLQDVEINEAQGYKPNQGIVIQPKDMLSIVISSREPSLVAYLNLPTVQYQAGGDVVAPGQRLLSYLVDPKGEIDFPVLGKISVVNMTRYELSESIKTQLVARGLVKDPIVTIQFLNNKVSVMGEVKMPGTYSIEGDYLTILDALSKAGDLTIYGRRDNVMVIREKKGVREVFKVDLRSKSLFDSPVYYLQQNDVVYVEPNGVRAGQSNINENSFKSVTFWMSAASLIASLIVLFTK